MSSGINLKTSISIRFNANLTYQHGHPILTLTLPSRNQPVAFTCKPVTGTVGSLINDIIKEDGGVREADIRTEVRLTLIGRNFPTCDLIG